jgi:hypothetical protein
MICPICYWNMPETQNRLEAERRNAQDQLEADSRNATEEQRRRTALSQHEAVFRAQGYGEVAAEAMAKRRFREEDPPIREWSASDIAKERHLAERQRNIDAGKAARCPHCSTYAPASEGVILAHRTMAPAAEDGYVPCVGEGMQVAEG